MKVHQRSREGKRSKKKKFHPGLGHAVAGATAMKVEPVRILPEPPEKVRTQLSLVADATKEQLDALDPDETRRLEIEQTHLADAWLSLHCPSKSVNVHGKAKENHYGIISRKRYNGTLPVRPIAIGPEQNMQGAQCKDEAAYLKSLNLSAESKGSAPAQPTHMPVNADALGKVQQRWLEKVRPFTQLVTAIADTAEYVHNKWCLVYGGTTLRERHSAVIQVQAVYGCSLADARRVLKWASQDPEAAKDLEIEGAMHPALRYGDAVIDHPDMEIVTTMVDDEVTQLNAANDIDVEEEVEQPEVEQPGPITRSETVSEWDNMLGYSLASYLGLRNHYDLYDMTDEFINDGLKSLHNTVMLSNIKHPPKLTAIATVPRSTAHKRALLELKRAHEPVIINNKKVLGPVVGREAMRKNLAVKHHRKAWSFAQWMKHIDIAYPKDVYYNGKAKDTMINQEHVMLGMVEGLDDSRARQQRVDSIAYELNEKRLVNCFPHIDVEGLDLDIHVKQDVLAKMQEIDRLLSQQT